MTKTIILAICGKSAVGKDSLAEQLIYEFTSRKIPFNYIVSDTTRPPRPNERNGIDYHFITDKEFIWNKNKNKYIEYSNFRHWNYGTHKNSIDLNTINIGVFNLDGIKSLRKYRQQFLIIPIFLDEDLIIRLRRSYRRESRWRIEFFRRAFTDWRDFKDINRLLNFFKYYIILKDERTVFIKAQKIIYMLEAWGIIAAGQKPINYIL